MDEVSLYMDIVFDRLQRANLTVGCEKVLPCRRSRVFLGFLLDEQGIREHPERSRRFKQCRKPFTACAN